MERLIAFFSFILIGCTLFPQEATDKLKSSSDKAQDVFDKVSGAPAAGAQLPVEVMPEYPGGTSALYQFVAKETKYPEEAREQGITGKVLVKFIVGKDGAVDSVSIMRGAHPLLDAEAMRVVGSMQPWTPGTQDGKPVRVQYVLPITFDMPAKDLAKIRKKAAKKAAKERQ
jgi:TonB family protein